MRQEGEEPGGFLRASSTSQQLTGERAVRRPCVELGTGEESPAPHWDAEGSGTTAQHPRGSSLCCGEGSEVPSHPGDTRDVAPVGTGEPRWISRGVWGWSRQVSLR